jgi:hypothetical protein
MLAIEPFLKLWEQELFGLLLAEVTQHIRRSGRTPDPVLRVVFEQVSRPGGATTTGGDGGHRGCGATAHGTAGSQRPDGAHQTVTKRIRFAVLDAGAEPARGPPALVGLVDR